MSLYIYIKTIATNAARRTGVHISFQIGLIAFFRYIPKNEIAESYCISLFSFLRKFHIAFYNGCTNLHQQYKKAPFSLHPHQHVLFAFLMIDTQWRVNMDKTMFLWKDQNRWNLFNLENNQGCNRSTHWA